MQKKGKAPAELFDRGENLFSAQSGAQFLLQEAQDALHIGVGLLSGEGAVVGPGGPG